MSEFLENIEENNCQPNCDIIICGKCKGTFKVADCPTIEEGDWETGYYTVHECPVCEDGGEPEYDMSEKRAKEWYDWFKQQKEAD